jgi:hypothetical protein
MSDKVPTEHQEQIGLVNWFRSHYPHLLIFAIPNGEKRAISVAKRLKAEGVVSGVPDLAICLPEGRMLFVEMKRIKGSRLSQEQKDVHKLLENLGHSVIIGYGAKDASEKIIIFLHKALAS